VTGSARSWAMPLAELRTWLGPAGLLLGLAAIVAARWLATRRGLDALAVGAVFGATLAGLWLAAAWLARGRAGRPDRVAPRPAARRMTIAVAAGIAFGLGLVGLTMLGAAIAGAPLIPGLSRPAAPFVPWAVITIVVATAEEGILRGMLFDRLRAAGGLPIAIAVTSLAFALLHVPLYGWHVVPLDLAVGFGLAGLRLSTASVVAPAIAHAVADLATWWL
jgi:membrane protease YdiL (CAAX protease family)